MINTFKMNDNPVYFEFSANNNIHIRLDTEHGKHHLLNINMLAC